MKLPSLEQLNQHTDLEPREGELELYLDPGEEKLVQEEMPRAFQGGVLIALLLQPLLVSLYLELGNQVFGKLLPPLIRAVLLKWDL